MTDVSNPKVQKILQSQAMAHLATIGPKDEPQSSPMWFVWDGEYLKFTHTTDRQKYRNIKRDPRVSISVTDVDDPCTYAEFRGAVEKIEDDSKGDFLNTLARRYRQDSLCPQGEQRVILSVRVHYIVGFNL
jgi:PPOX class probable F420-dependent enzyme